MKGITVAMMALLSTLAGCTDGGEISADKAQLERGLVLVLPGIDGKSYLNKAICKGLRRGGVDRAIELYDWTVAGRWTALYNLRAEKRNRLKAAQIARRIVRYQQSHPGRPVVLVGQSGGASMAIWTAEAMSPANPVDGIILLAGALSPTYRLDKALARSRMGIVNFYSAMDWWFLGAGTLVFGTSDGRHVCAAGRMGFVIPDDDVDGIYHKLHQVAWTSEMRKRWNLGGHLTSTSPRYIADFVAPLVKAEAWDRQFIDHLPKPRKD